MNYYLDIQLREDPAFDDNILMSTLFSKLHRVLVKLESQDIGISFPKKDVKKANEEKPKPGLGACLRLHGSQQSLEKLMLENWLKGLTDHMDVGNIRSIPAKVTVQHRTVKRVQVKSSVERLRRRAIAKGVVSPEEAEIRIPISKQQITDLPYVRVSSASSRQQFRLFIEHSPLQDQPILGSFNTYGLSQSATIPWW